jgi:TDG/mug DNA glycosylase family protein
MNQSAEGYRAIINWRGKQILSLEDIAPKPLKVLFIGINPSLVSMEIGHYHMGRLGKRFWKRLEEFGIIEHTSGFNDDRLKSYGFGITDIVKTPSRRGREIQDDLEYGRRLLLGKIESWKPEKICFIYKLTAESLLGRKLVWNTARIEGELCGAALFHMPSPYASKEDEGKIMNELRAAFEV